MPGTDRQPSGPVWTSSPGLDDRVHHVVDLVVAAVEHEDPFESTDLVRREPDAGLDRVHRGEQVVDGDS